MRLSRPPAFFSLLFTILLTAHTSNARPNLSDDERRLLESRYHYLSERDCPIPCGWAGQICCQSGQTCGTNSAGQAVCNGGAVAANAQGAGWEFYTTTFIETNLVTRVSTYSSFLSAPSATAAPAQISGISCNSGLGESPCGTICCATGQYCAYAGQCVASNGNGDGSSTILGQIITATNTAPLRPTSNAVTTVTSTGTKTTTTQFGTPSASPTAAGGTAAMSTTNNNGLTGGQIAGIVIGVIAGIILLILLLLCCCGVAFTDAILGFFGLRNNKRRQTTVIEEHRHHHSGSHGAGAGRRWFGMGPARIDRPPKKDSGIGGLTAVAGGLGALAILLGLKRRRDKKIEKSEYSGSSYYTDYYSSQSKSKSKIFCDQVS